MLPATDLSTLRRPAEVKSLVTDNTPIAMQSLRNLKERRRAIAHQITAGVSKTLEAKLATQAMDIAYLKKERDQIISDREKEFNELKKQIEEKHDQTKRRLDDVEAVSARVPSLMDRTETLKLVNAAAKPLTERLEVLEKSDTGLPDLRKGLQDLAAVPETLATLESRQAAKPEPDQFNVFVKSELISIRDRLDSTLAKIHRLENDITTLKTAKELHGIDIGALKTWKDAQPKAVSEVTTNNLIAAQVKEKASVVLKTLSEKTDEANHKLAERFNDNKAEIRSHQLELQEFKSFKENYKQELANQLSVLYERVKTVEGNNAKTYAKADKLQNKLQKLENDLHKVEDDVDDLSPSGMDNIHDKLEEMRRTDDKLLDKVQEIREEMKSMNKDLLSFEKDFSDYQDDIVKYIGRIKSDYKDTGKSLSERVAALRTTLTEADLSRLPVRLSELEKSARNVDRLAVRVDELDKLPPRVDELERAPKGPNFKRVGTPVFPSSTVAKAPETGDLDSKVDSLDKSLQRLRKTVEGKNSLTSRMDRQEERIDSIEASSASARPLETVEQTVETEDRALDKTVEKAVEKRVKTLVTEQKAAKNLEELKTRLIEEIRASRNKGHEQSAQFDMNALSVTQQGLETLQEKFEDHDAIISSIQEMVPNLFREHFAPLKASVEQQAQIISNTLDQHSHDIFNLNRQVANLPTQQNILGQQQQQAQLEGMVAEAVSLRTAFAALQTSLSRKVDAERMHQQLQGMNQQLQGTTFALNNLQSRYENINTDDMYKRMVEWFTRQYPSVTQIQNEIKELRAAKMLADPHGSFIALSRDAESLHGLLRIAPQLRGLVDTKQAATSEGQIVNVSTAEIQRRLIEDANTLENLQNRLEEDKIERVTELEHLRFRVSDERRARADAEAEIKKTISNLFAIVSNNASTIKKETKECSDQLRQIKSDYEAAVPEIRDQLSNVQKAGAELRKEFDATVKAYIEPNRNLFGIMDNVITVVAQVQQILESVNQNLPKGPLKLDWVCYLPKHGQLENNGELENNSELQNNGEPSNSKGKGKSKQ
jgi:DNA repair exonuclease SbcCD ATPase subunit